MRATISTFNQDSGALRTIYLHDCGSVPRFFALLKEHYGNQNAVDVLIDLGDLSSIGPKLTPTKGSGHSFNKPEPDVTVAYHRDRDEKLHIQRSADWVGYVDFINDSNVNVIFDGERWKLYFHQALIEV